MWNILENLKIDQPSHPDIPLLGVYSKDLANTCPTMFTDALVTISPYSGNMCTQTLRSEHLEYSMDLPSSMDGQTDEEDDENMVCIPE